MPVPFVLDPDSTVPIFRQIAEGLRAGIARGALKAGDLLPSVRLLAEELGVNPNTVHRAVLELERDGLVSSERGRGMLVRSGTVQSARATGEDALLAKLVDAVRHAQAIGLDAERFGTLLERAQRTVGTRSNSAVAGRSAKGSGTTSSPTKESR